MLLYQHMSPYLCFAPQDFLIKLVISLLEEGNSCFRDGHWEQAVGEFGEGLNVCHYVSGEGFHIPQDLLASLYVNRATAYHSMVSLLSPIEIDRSYSVTLKQHTAPN